MKIALIEDNPVISGIIKENLMERGHQVLHRKTIKSFELLINAFQPDLIITDVLISGVSSRELTDYYRQFECPIFVMSSIDEDDLSYFAETIHARAFFQKPFNPKDMIKKIDILFFEEHKTAKI